MSDTPAWYSCWKDLFAQIGHRGDRLLSRQDLSDQEIRRATAADAVSAGGVNLAH